MASWREQVGSSASFRGVSFRVGESELGGGRKTVKHEYPGKDIAFIEDLGRRARRFSVKGYVVGDDYLQQRDALLVALEQEGDGPLVHPYHGNRRVAAVEFSCAESVEEGGIARFTIEFAETETTAFSPVVGVAPAARVNGAGDHTLTTLQNRYASKYSLTLPTIGKTAPAFTFDSVSKLITDYSTTLRNTLSPAIKGTQDLANFKHSFDKILSDVNMLVRQPTALAQRFADVLKSFREMPLTSRIGLGALMAAYAFTTTALRPAVATTPSRSVEQSNFDATTTLLKSMTVVEAANQAVATAAASGRSQTPTITPDSTDVDDLGGFDSYDDAIESRDEIFAAIDTEADNANDDEIYSALIQLRAELAQAIPGDDNHLARLIAYTPPISIPSLVIAYRLYGDLALADDIVTRNHVRHPGFVLGSRPLQVLSHG